MATLKKPGIIVNYNPVPNNIKVINDGSSELTAESGPEDSIDIELTLKFRVKGKIFTESFDPDTLGIGADNLIYLPFDDADKRTINYILIDKYIRMTDIDPGTAPISITPALLKFGKSRWGKDRWGADERLDNLFADVEV